MDKLERWLKGTAFGADTAEFAAHRAAAVAEIELFKQDPARFAPALVLPTPPGQPIGTDDGAAIWQPR